jgi:hypothetical protein
MMIALVLAVVVAVVTVLVLRSRKARQVGEPSERSALVDAWATGAVEQAVRSVVLPATPTSDEQNRFAKTLRGEPDADMVALLERAVRKVDLEYLRFDHETDVELSLTVSYDDGRDASTSRRRFAMSELPEAVRHEFDHKATQRVFRAWAFPWAR